MERHPLQAAVADDNEEKIGSEAANFLREDFYVDDGLKSVPSIDEAVKLVKDVKEMCKRGGFNLHKFVSNSKEVIHSIPVEDRAEDIKKPGYSSNRTCTRDPVVYRKRFLQLSHHIE